jgi:hypothetical protein
MLGDFLEFASWPSQKLCKIVMDVARNAGGMGFPWFFSGSSGAAA